MMKPVQQNANDHSESPSLTDEALNDLLLRVCDFFDEDFDAGRMHLQPEELDALLALLIQDLTANLRGKLLSSILNTLRNRSESQEP